MTTIAYRDGVLAADTLSSSSGTVAGYQTKIYRERGLLLGGAGSVAAFERFRDWIRSGMAGDCPLQKDIGNMFVITPDGRCTMWCDDGPFRITADFWALGSGELLALGAMEVGASAAEAVRAAIKHDTRSGGDVTTLRLEPR